MGKMKRYGKNQGKIYRSVFLLVLTVMIVIGCTGFGLYKFMKPKYEEYQIEKAEQKQAEQERLKKEKEQAMYSAMEGGTRWEGHTYKAIDEGMTWSDAKAYCDSVGGHLMIIESQEEQTFAEGLLNNKNFYWLGAFVNPDETDAGWHWVNGESLDYANWQGSQPDNFTGNETCLMMYNYPNPLNNTAVKGSWNDAQEDGECNDEEFFGADNSGFICEWDFEG